MELNQYIVRYLYTEAEKQDWHTRDLWISNEMERLTKIYDAKIVYEDGVAAAKAACDKKIKELTETYRKVKASCNHEVEKHHSCPAGGRTETECLICGKWS